MGYGADLITKPIPRDVYDDTSEGRKVCTYYKLDSVPAFLVIDPIIGQKMSSWSGMVQLENLLEDLVAFMDGGPKDHYKTLSHKCPRGSSRTPDKDKGEMEVKFQLNRDTFEDMLAGWKLFGPSIEEAEAVELFYLIPIPVTLVACPMVLVLSSYTCTK
ncbi:hypothetical protein K2173_027432 [Erythroxylum novogranatense]|uniref:Thioredoxin domain-containing protein n=1 Tax=Erythroxylum novogranatense TaxID=1862640 RepID=A0AAV8TZ68_9ROSI|nr:hypothetical protein K2173_027432 [Erythroxylum novogranatense]